MSSNTPMASEENVSVNRSSNASNEVQDVAAAAAASSDRRAGKRRRDGPPVDYAALDEKIKREEAK